MFFYPFIFFLTSLTFSPDGHFSKIEFKERSKNTIAVFFRVSIFFKTLLHFFFKTT